MTTEWPPLAEENARTKGLVVEIVQEAYRRAGVETTVLFVPFKRALQMAEGGEVDGLVVSSLTPEREEYMAFSDWSFPNEIRFWAPAGHKKTYKAVQELCPARVGVLRGSHVARKIASLHCMQPVLVDSKKAIVGMLKLGRIDYAVDGMRELRYWVKHEGAGGDFQMIPLSPAFFVDRYHTTIVKTRPDAATLLEAFDRAIREMRDDGTMCRIITSYDE